MKRTLAEDAMENEFMYENIEEFEKRVISDIHELVALHMDRTIESMPKRILEVVKNEEHVLLLLNVFSASRYTPLVSVLSNPFYPPPPMDWS